MAMGVVRMGKRPAHITLDLGVRASDCANRAVSFTWFERLRRSAVTGWVAGVLDLGSAAMPLRPETAARGRVPSAAVGDAE